MESNGGVVDLRDLGEIELKIIHDSVPLWNRRSIEEEEGSTMAGNLCCLEKFGCGKEVMESGVQSRGPFGKAEVEGGESVLLISKNPLFRKNREFFGKRLCGEAGGFLGDIGIKRRVEGRIFHVQIVDFHVVGAQGERKQEILQGF